MHVAQVLARWTNHDKASTSIVMLVWDDKAQVRLCQRYRRLISRGTHPHVVTVAMARELAGCMGALATQVPETPASPDA